MAKSIAATLFIVWLAILSNSCDKGGAPKDIAPEDTLSQAEKDSIARFEHCAESATFPEIRYERTVIENKKQLREIWKDYHYKKFPDKHKIITTLNRKELKYFHVGDTIIVPDTFIADTRAYSVFPQCYYEAKDIPKIILVSNKLQCYACYENGLQVRFAAANTGKEKTPTYPGRYALVWKQRLRISSLDETWKMPFTWNFHRLAGSAFHQFAMPGRPVSHSCVRQFLDDAEWLFNWGEGAKLDSNDKFVDYSGTPVIILDIFDFTRKKYGPWIDLSSNRDSVLTLPEAPMDVEEALIPISQIPKDSRWALKPRDRYVYAEDTLRARGIIREGVKITPSINFNELRKQKAAAKAKKKKLEEEKRKKFQDNENALEKTKTSGEEPVEEKIENGGITPTNANPPQPPKNKEPENSVPPNEENSPD